MEPLEGKMANTPRLDPVSTKRQRIAELARQAPEAAFTSLSHYIDIDFLRAAHAATRKDGAVGLDGQTAEDYAANLEANLQSLLNRFKSGGYKAPPVRRVNIPKGDGRKTRPIGIPTFEDKILQRAVSMVLESVYEQDFQDSSFGFRPGRSAHHALQVIRDKAMAMRGGWVIDLDIQGFFDALDHGHLRSFLDQRVRDGVLRRAIDKWLKAGVMEEGRLSRSALGTPQGGVVSPILANVYLHHVLDVWFATEVQPRLRGGSFLVRYADDVVILTEAESDAQRIMDVLPKRLARFGLTMHPEKSRLVRFGQPRFTWRPGQDDDDGFRPPGTFDFLGFTHYWGMTRKGGWALKRKTAKDRLRRSLKAVNRWCRMHRHWSIAEQHQMLVRKLRGHCAYYGITGNASNLTTFCFHVVHIWQKWLNRRSQRRSMPWKRFLRLLVRYPVPRMAAIHSATRA
jgi:group II intron reverse transcriptase/maturase